VDGRVSTVPVFLGPLPLCGQTPRGRAGSCPMISAVAQAFWRWMVLCSSWPWAVPSAQCAKDRRRIRPAQNGGDVRSKKGASYAQARFAPYSFYLRTRPSQSSAAARWRVQQSPRSSGRTCRMALACTPRAQSLPSHDVAGTCLLRQLEMQSASCLASKLLIVRSCILYKQEIAGSSPALPTRLPTL
jgi:hypothetical protein